MGPLTEHFLPHLAGPAPAGAELEPLLEELLARARAAWPTVELDPAVFLPYLAERVQEIDRLGQLHVGDLHLVCACVQGHQPALELFAGQVIAIVDVALGRAGCDPCVSEEVKQELRCQALVGDGERPPKILTFSGRGTLSGWLQVTAVRMAQRILKRSRRQAPADDAELEQLAAPHHDQELAHLKQLYRREFSGAFQQALTTLSSRERNILRYHYIEDLNIDLVGGIYGVHRSTVARWLERIRGRLLEATREAMIQALQIERGEFESIMRLIKSQLEISVVQWLGPEPED